MKYTGRKIFVALVASTLLLQGWPILMAATCTMANAETACAMQQSCCCQSKQHDHCNDPGELAFRACTQGNAVAGVLATDPGLIPATDKLKKELQATAKMPALPDFQLQQRFGYSASLLSQYSTILRLPIAPLYLLDCTFLI